MIQETVRLLKLRGIGLNVLKGSEEEFISHPERGWTFEGPA